MPETVSHPQQQSYVDQLFLLCRAELRRVAHGLMRRERRGHTLQSTELLHEVYIQIRRARGLSIRDDVHFRRLMVRHMRWYLYGYARKHSKRKGMEVLGLDAIDHPESTSADSSLQGGSIRYPNRFVHLLDELRATGEKGALQAELVELIFFNGFSKKSAAELLGISERQGRREWEVAKDWLETRLDFSRT